VVLRLLRQERAQPVRRARPVALGAREQRRVRQHVHARRGAGRRLLLDGGEVRARAGEVARLEVDAADGGAERGRARLRAERLEHARRGDKVLWKMRTRRGGGGRNDNALSSRRAGWR
jgi:hypothetical protein